MDTIKARVRYTPEVKVRLSEDFHKMSMLEQHDTIAEQRKQLADKLKRELLWVAAHLDETNIIFSEEVS